MYTKLFCLSVCFVICLFVVTAVGDTTPASTSPDQYLSAVANYFDVSYDKILSYSTNLATDEVPVACLIAQLSKTSIQNVVDLKKKNDYSWCETASRLGMNTANFYVIVTGTITSTTFAPIFEKFNSTPEQEWRKLRLSDEEVVNLVNLRLIYSHYDYSAYKVMAARDTNPSWVTVGKIIADAKQEYLKSLMAK